MMWFELIKSQTYTRESINEMIRKHRRADEKLSFSNKPPEDTDEGQLILMIAPLLKRLDGKEFEYVFSPHRKHGGSGGKGINPKRLVRNMERQMRLEVNLEYNEHFGKGWVNYNNSAFDLWNKEHHETYMQQLGLAVNPMCAQTHIKWLKKIDTKDSSDMNDLYEQWSADNKSYSAGINEEHTAYHEFKRVMNAMCAVGGEE